MKVYWDCMSGKLLLKRRQKESGPKKPAQKGHRIRFTSLRYELTLLFFVLMAGTIVVLVLMNNFFLGRYYISQRRRTLEQTYILMNEAAENGTLGSDDFDVTMSKICSSDNLSCIVVGEDSKKVLSYAADETQMFRRVYDNIFGVTQELPDNYSDSDDTAIGSNNRYYIVQTSTTPFGQREQIILDRMTNSRFMELWGQLSDNSYCLIHTPLESIQNETKIANRFIFYVGISAILIGLAVSMYLGKRITRPIHELSDLAKRMQQLDFSARYEGDDLDEVGTLGKSMNEMSTTLETTISELKTANNELKRDLEQKEKKEQMQQEFISNVTHELKTPIALIQGYAEGLQDGMADDPESRDLYTGVIVDEAGKMNKMVQQLLSLMHLEFGEVEVDFERFNVVELISDYLKSAGKLADEKNMQIRKPQEEPIYVWSDPFMVQEVFQNYFTNAVNHCESEGAGEKVIDIRFEEKDNCVRISVFNTGKPIPEESIDRIWDKFYKVDKARTRAYGGSGVGLSIVKAVMELLHQDYGVINDDNGVTFWFELETKALDSSDIKKE